MTAKHQAIWYNKMIVFGNIFGELGKAQSINFIEILVLPILIIGNTSLQKRALA